MRALLDVNALIALLDEEHIHHAEILGWLRRAENLSHGFATCAITQLGAIRVMSGKGYYKPVETGEVAEQLQGLTRKGHRYLGIPAPSEGAIRWKATGTHQSTDATLLSTAVAHGCRLVTFDAGIPLPSVAGARKEHLVVLGS
ncbi:MAG TPA: PIN domain-containing protein [Usitatibacter sp.]|nr:PIN domain-containing protein [Usitatibacter sp.]